MNNFIDLYNERQMSYEIIFGAYFPVFRLMGGSSLWKYSDTRNATTLKSIM